MTVAIISEDFVGARAQAKGLLQRLGTSAQICDVRLRGLWKTIPTRFCPYPLKAIDPIGLAPDVEWLLSVGGRGGAVGVALKKKTGLKLVQIQNPRMRLDLFDLVIANHHDRIDGGNVIHTLTALHGVTPQKLAEAAAAWAPQLREPGKPLLSVLLGGDNGRYRFGPKEGREIGRLLAKRVRETGVSLAVTPSRRSDPHAISALSAELSGLSYYLWSGEGANPYLGLLGAADMIAVTQDSVSMVSEAVATTAPVEIIRLPGHSRRITDFISRLEAMDRVRSFSTAWDPWTVSSLDDTGLAVNEVKRRLEV